MSIVKIYVYRSYGVATAHQHSRMLFIYPLINVSSKNASDNRYSTNLAFWVFVAVVRVRLYVYCNNETSPL